MSRKNVAVLSLSCGVALLISGCVPENGDDNPFGYGSMGGSLSGGEETSETDTDTDTDSSSGDGDGDPTTTSGDGDGDQTTGDGDGEPTTGDPTTGDPTTGDPTTGDPTTGDGDGDCDGESPYIGGWDIGCCQDAIAGNGWNPGGIGPGTVLPDWTFTDQNGDAVRIYDFCHEAIYFEYVALW